MSPLILSALAIACSLAGSVIAGFSGASQAADDPEFGASLFSTLALSGVALVLAFLAGRESL